MAQTLTRKDDVIQIRASAEAKALLMRAAALKGQKLSEFMLSSARREAENALLDARAFLLSEADYERFLELLDNPPPLTVTQRRRLERKPPWSA